ncbi:methylenetetrahydrofolate reductase [Diplonema papillatum]|nr:methylenetetrahydrofolate reductase [Diplonema papillatum]
MSSLRASKRVKSLVDGWSIEVVPRTAAKVTDFREILPQHTRIYLAHITGTSIDSMVATAKRLRQEGFRVMPHIPARLIPSTRVLEQWVRRYKLDADVSEALLLSGSQLEPVGSLESSLQLLESGLFETYGFTHLHVAGHPEGCITIDKKDSTELADQALKLKQAYIENTSIKMAIVTQFAFDAKVIADWTVRIQTDGIALPVHIGVAGPASMKTLLQFASSCGVRASANMFQQQPSKLSRLLLQHKQTDIVRGLCTFAASNPKTLIEQFHLFPFGGIQASARWMEELAISYQSASYA